MQTFKSVTRQQFLRAQLALHGKSVTALARKAGVHYSLLYRIIRGERRSARLERFLAAELAMPVRKLRGMK